MRLLLIEKYPVARHAIATGLVDLPYRLEIAGYPDLETFAANEVSPRRFDCAVVESGPAAQQKENFKNLRSLIGRSCRLIILTDYFDAVIAETASKHGIEQYLSKCSIDVFGLWRCLTYPESRIIPPRDRKLVKETYVSGLSRAEVLATLCEQGALALSDLSEAMSVESDTIKKYMQRARRRQAR